MMDRKDYADADYGSSAVPPATPPVVNPNADPLYAAELAQDNGDSDFPGSRPDEKPPQQDDVDRPAAPDEIQGEPGDNDQPGEVPDEVQPLPGVMPPPD